jgi:hypothetical protein
LADLVSKISKETQKLKQEKETQRESTTDDQKEGQKDGQTKVSTDTVDQTPSQTAQEVQKEPKTSKETQKQKQEKETRTESTSGQKDEPPTLEVDTLSPPQEFPGLQPFEALESNQTIEQPSVQRFSHPAQSSLGLGSLEKQPALTERKEPESMIYTQERHGKSPNEIKKPYDKDVSIPFILPLIR